MIIRSYGCYRAEISNGVILENEKSFKRLYRGAVHELRDTYGHNLYFTCGNAELYYGIITEVWEGSRCRYGWIELRKICDISCFSIDRKTTVTTIKAFRKGC